MSEKAAENTVSLLGQLDSGLPYKIEIPVIALEKLVCGERWRGVINLHPSAKSSASRRQKAIESQIQEKGQFNNVIRATVDERTIIRAWNRSPYIKSQLEKEQRESRNHPLPFKEIAKALPLVRKAIREVGVAPVIRNMETYFDFCLTGGHIWEGQNHGYKTLTGFLEKLIVIHKEKKQPWWDIRDTPSRIINDDNARLTNRIANSFAQTFMQEDKFPLVPGSKEHHHFMKTAVEIQSFIKRKSGQGIELTQTQMIRALLEFVQELFDNAPVYPAHLPSSSIWYALPQFLDEKGLI